MKKLLLALILVCNGYLIAKDSDANKKSISAKDLAEHSKKWAKQVVQKLSTEELQLLANYLYFNFIATRYDHLINTSFIACQNQLIAMQFLLHTRSDEAYKNGVALCKQIEFVINEATASHIYAVKSGQACFEHIEDSEFSELKNTISKFQNYSKSAVNQFIQKDWSKSITKLFSTCADSMQKETEKLSTLKEDLQAKALLDTDEEQDAEFFGTNFQEAINVTNASYASYLTLLTNMLNVKSMSADILNISAIIYNIFYNSLLETLKTNKKITSLPIMFDENGLIDEDDQDELLVMLNEKFSINSKHIKKLQE